VSGRFLRANARTWGYHSLGREAGVDFPFLLYCDQLEEPVVRQRAQPGVSWMRFATDFPTALSQIFSGRLSWKRYLRSVRSANVGAVFAREDPLPAIAELALMPYLAIRRGF
jgi:D-aspartate ligase